MTDAPDTNALGLTPRVQRAALGYGIAWFVAVADWIWFRGALLPFGFLEAARVGLRWAVFAASVPVGVACLVWAFQPSRRRRWGIAVASLVFVPWYQFSLIVADALGYGALRASIAEFGTVAMYFLGLCWGMYGLERAARRFDQWRLNRRLAKMQDSDAEIGLVAAPAESAPTPAAAEPSRRRLNSNPLDPDAWYYRLAPSDWFSPRRFKRVLADLRKDPDNEYGRERRKLNQSLAGFCGYSLAFYLSLMLMTQLGGCGEVYEMPAGGGGPDQQIVQQVKVQKVIKKKYVINPFSAFKFKIPPIDDVKLQLTEVTKHLYQVGQGKGGMGYGTGDGSGFFGGTGAGKVRFIRLEYTGGDWDQDFGVGADLNMLTEAGIRLQLTGSKIAKETEKRTIAELKGFPKFKSPPYVFMTGQRNITLANNEIKILREYLLDKHGMIFCDNGGSAHFHNQFFAMMNQVLPDVRPVQIPLDDVIHKTPYAIPFLPYVAPHGGRDAWGWKVDGRWVTYYHPGDIGDAWSDGHSGVNSDVWEACYQLGTNVIFYAHVEYAKWLEAQQQQQKGK